MSKPIIEVNDLSKRYQLGAVGATRLRDELERWWARLRNPSSAREKEEFWALRDVSFQISPGQIVGVIGRNGAGKSTLLKILSRITEPTSGEAILRGRVASLLEVGTGFHPDLTGRENLFLNGAIMGMRKEEIRRKFDEIVTFAEVEQFIDTPVKRYSSGMYVRLAFAIAAHLEPEVLIIDEVLAVGDLNFQRKSLGKMDDISRRRGATVIFVSHQMSSIRKLCTRALLLEKGRVIEDGEVETVLDQYFEQSSAGQSSVNQLKAGDANATAVARELIFVNSAGKPASEFLLGERWRARLRFEVRKAVPHCVVALGLRTHGTAAITWWSEAADLQAGGHEAEFVCDVPLSSGHYSCVIGISSHEKAIYYHEDAASCTITDLAVGEQPFRAGGSGICFSTQRPIITPIS